MGVLLIKKIFEGEFAQGRWFGFKTQNLWRVFRQQKVIYGTPVNSLGGKGKGERGRDLACIENF
jgi:hypothetical protein